MLSNRELADLAFRIDNLTEDLQNLVYQKESILKQIEMIEHGQTQEKLDSLGKEANRR